MRVIQVATNYLKDQCKGILDFYETQGARHRLKTIRATKQQSIQCEGISLLYEARGGLNPEHSYALCEEFKPTKQQSTKAKDRAFSLIEVLFAMTIMAGVLIAVSGTWSGTINSQKKSEKMQLIASLMKSKITELELKYSKLGYGEIPDEESGDFGSDIKDLSWKVEIQNLEFPDLRPLMTSTGDIVNEQLLTMVKQMTDQFSKNTKEMKLIVTWNTGKKPISYTATTYIVNFSGGLPSMGGG